jgi:Zn-dependent protease
MRTSWPLGTWRGVSITLHWTVLLGLPYYYYLTRSVSYTAISFAAFLFLMFVHELGHAAVAAWRHVEVERIRLLFLHGVCVHEEPYHEEDDVLIAWGGVAAQLVVLIVALGADLLLTMLAAPAPPAVWALLRVLINTNLFLMVFNLIPLAPFDGAKAWRVLPLLREWAARTSWGASLRRRSAARERARTKKLEANAERITAEIIDKLKKGKSDA